MRLLLITCFSILFASCNSGNSNSRSYVITQAQETAADTEVTAEPPVD